MCVKAPLQEILAWWSTAQGEHKDGSYWGVCGETKKAPASHWLQQGRVKMVPASSSLPGKNPSGPLPHRRALKISAWISFSASGELFPLLLVRAARAGESEQFSVCGSPSGLTVPWSQPRWFSQPDVLEAHLSGTVLKAGVPAVGYKPFPLEPVDLWLFWMRFLPGGGFTVRLCLSLFYLPPSGFFICWYEGVVQLVFKGNCSFCGRRFGPSSGGGKQCPSATPSWTAPSLRGAGLPPHVPQRSLFRLVTGAASLAGGYWCGTGRSHPRLTSPGNSW